MKPILVALAAVLVLAAPAAAAAPAYVIQADRKVGGLEIGRSTPAHAHARFGAPSLMSARPPYTCVLSWRRLGLTATFLDVSDGRPCRSGVLLRATLTSRTRWRTAVGLRVGDQVSRIRLMYPRATFRRSLPEWTGYWLVARRTCELGGRQPYPGLLARVRGGRVTALVASTTACE